MELCEINSPADLANYRARLPTLTGLNSISNVQITVFPSGGKKSHIFFWIKRSLLQCQSQCKKYGDDSSQFLGHLNLHVFNTASGQLGNCAYNLVSCTKRLCHHPLASAFQHAEQLKSSAFLRSNVFVQAFSVPGEETWLPLLIPQVLQ